MKYAILLLSLVASILSYSQTTDSTTQSPKVFTVVEQMPEYPGGEGALFKFIKKNITYPDSARNNDIQGRVVVGFVVNEDGSLSDVSIKKGISRDLDEEAVRVIKLLPNFKPGKQQGKPVKVAYVLPIAFKLTPTDTQSLKSDTVYQIVDQMPVFPGGDEAMLKFIQRNIQYPDMERRNDIQGKVVVGFVIKEDGSINDVGLRRGASKGLDEEAIRVAKLLPNFKPGMQKGQPVKVAFILPIMFKLESSEPVKKKVKYKNPTPQN